MPMSVITGASSAAESELALLLAVIKDPNKFADALARLQAVRDEAQAKQEAQLKDRASLAERAKAIDAEVDAKYALAREAVANRESNVTFREQTLEKSFNARVSAAAADLAAPKIAEAEATKQKYEDRLAKIDAIRAAVSE